jgi:hypothetical protein
MWRDDDYRPWWELHLGHPDRTLPPCNLRERGRRRARMREEGISPEHIPLRLRIHRLETLGGVNLWQLTVARADLDGMEFEVARYYYPKNSQHGPVFRRLQQRFRKDSTDVGLEQFDVWLHNFRKVVKEYLSGRDIAPPKEMHPWEPEDQTVFPDCFVTDKDTRRISRRLDDFLGRLPRAVRIMLNADLQYASLED